MTGIRVKVIEHHSAPLFRETVEVPVYVDQRREWIYSHPDDLEQYNAACRRCQAWADAIKHGPVTVIG